jgi:hypothetical protein
MILALKHPEEEEEEELHPEEAMSEDEARVWRRKFVAACRYGLALLEAAVMAHLCTWIAADGTT